MSKLGIRELLRYGYAGLICGLAVAVVDWDFAKEIIDALGDVLAPLVTVALGSIFYVTFRALIGDLFLWKMMDGIHIRGERFLEKERPDRGTRCKVRFLEEHFSVPRGQGLGAYALLRDRLFPEHARDRFHVQHSEGFLLFYTAFVSLILALFAWVFDIGNSNQQTIVWVSLALGIVSFFAGTQK